MDLARVRDQITTCSKNTERIYSALGSSFPSLMALNKDSSDSSLARLDEIFGFLRSGFLDSGNGKSHFMTEYNQRSQQLFTDLNQRMSALDGINSRIDDIRRDSEELEIISLNAMVISIKSGEKGRAFSCITENLKRLSARMISLSNELIQNEKNLLDKTAQLKTSFSSVLEANMQSSSGITAEQEILLADALDAAGEQLEALQETARSVLSPIQNAMGGIQLQDIIRQSIDQILLVLSEIGESYPNSSIQDRLDLVTLNSGLFEVCHCILEDILVDLEKSRTIFSQNWTTVYETLDRVESMRRSFIRRFLDSSGGTTSIAVLLDGMSSDFSSFISHISLYQRGQKTMVKDSSAIVSEVKHLRTLFDTIKPIISRLQHVRITQQIEVAKNPAIAAVKDTVEHMSDLIMKADIRVQETRKELEQFISGIEKLTSGYSVEAELAQTELERIRQERIRFFGRMKEYQGELSSVIQSLHVYPDTFQDMCVSVEKLFTELSEKISVIRGLSEAFTRHISELDADKKSLLGKIGEDSWEIHNEKLRTLSRRFTISTHKEAAGQIGRFEVEKAGIDSIESGDVTLFF